MLGLNTITLLSSRVGSFIKRIVTDGLKMRLPFTSAEPLGEDLIVNGDFNEDTTGWVGQNANISVVGGELEVTSTVGYGKCVQNITTVVGKRYVLFAKVTAGTTTARLEIYSSPTSGAVGQSVSSGSRQVSLSFVAAATTIQVQLKCQSASLGTAYFDNISVEEYAQETPDTSNNGNDAILKTGKCLIFDGGNDGIDISNFSMAGSEGTFAFWCKPDLSGTTDYIIDLAESNAGRFSIVVDATRFRVFTQTGGSGGNWTYAPNNSITFNEWQRVVVTIDSSRNLKFYKNGVQLGSTLTSNAVLNIDNVVEAFIGRDHSSVAAAFDGCLSDFQIYNKVWSDVDVAYDYANPQSLVTDNLSSDIHLTNLKAWWHMSEGSGTIAYDSAPLIGQELVVNGDFATDSDWTRTGGWTIDTINNKAICKWVNNSLLYQSINGYSSGDVFLVSFTVQDYETGTLRIGTGAALQQPIGKPITANGVYSEYIVKTDNAEAFGFRSYSFNGSISNVSVKEVYNIDGETYHGSSFGATYDDAQERIPQLGMMNWSKGSNLIEYSEDLTEWSELSSAVVSFDSSIVNPDGTVGCYKVTFDGTFRGRIEYNVAIDGIVIQSVYLRVESGTQAAKIGGSSSSLGDVTVTDQWQRFSHSATYTGTSTNPRVRCDDAAVIYVWGVQYESGANASAYRRTNGTAVTDATLISCATDSQKDILSNDVESRNSSLNLDGTGYGEVPHTTDFDFGTGDFSVSAWVKYSHIAKGSSFNAIYTNGGGVDATNSFAIMSVNTPNRIAFLVNTTACTSTTTFSQGEWVHVVATRNSGTISLYINGNRTPEQTKNTTNTNATVTSSQNPRIGFDGDNARFYKDVIDDVQVYDRYLTPDEVEQNYKATKSAHTS
jgi:hypothetical protein